MQTVAREKDSDTCSVPIAAMNAPCSGVVLLMVDVVSSVRDNIHPETPSPCETDCGIVGLVQPQVRLKLVST